MPPLSIIVVLYESGDAAATLWDCLRAQTLADWTLIVIDNNSSDDAGEVFSKADDSRVVFSTNAANEGFARAVNAGIRTAALRGAERFLLLNPDVSFGPDFLRLLTDEWSARDAAVIAPRVMHQDSRDVSWYAGGSLEYGWIFTNRHDDYKTDGPGSRIVTFASGCCLGLSRRTVRAVGLLDETFFVYWEDTDYCLRLKEAGTPIHYVSEPVLFHKGGASSGGDRSPAAKRLYYRSYALLMKKHFGVRTAVTTALRVVLLERNRDGRISSDVRVVATALLHGLLKPLRAASSL